MSPPSPLWTFAFRGRDLLVRVDGAAVRLPSAAEWEALGLPAASTLEVGALGGASCRAVAIEMAEALPEGMELLGLRRLWGALDEEAWRLAGRAVQLLDWDLTHRFCGRCGEPTVAHPTQRSRGCPRCGLEQFPRLSPAVITLVTDGERLLLARSPHFAPGVYSTLAGFVEPGESLEEAVHREIAEEVGVAVADVRYFGSQPWPFPNSLMIGFTARYAGGEIVIDPAEIEDAAWFTPDALPELPSPMSIARALIEDFLAR